MSGDRAKTVIVGAGVAGLTLAAKLTEAGRRVTVLEREGRVGGLARSFRYGKFTFDVGPHRFHTYDDRILSFITSVLGDERLSIDRRSGVYLLGRYFEWPLNLGAVTRLPWRVQLGVIRDLFRRSGRSADREDLAGYLEGHYGQSLYRLFFQPYTERFVGVPCEELSRDWAATGIERALIDRGITADSLRRLVGSALRPRPRMQFLYPSRRGIGRFSEILTERVRSEGGSVEMGREVRRLELGEKRVLGVDTDLGDVGCENLVWTGSLVELCRLLGVDPPMLEYLDLVLFNISATGPLRSPFQWCYFSDPEVPFSRVSAPGLFDSALVPEGMKGLCIEVPVRRGGRLWDEPSALVSEIESGLRRVGMLASEDAVVDVEIERVRDAYPVYTLGYRDAVRSAKRALEGWGNVSPLGRSATFWYNNMDHSIGAALKLAERMARPGGTT